MAPWLSTFYWDGSPLYHNLDGNPQQNVEDIYIKILSPHHRGEWNEQRGEEGRNSLPSTLGRMSEDQAWRWGRGSCPVMIKGRLSYPLWWCWLERRGLQDEETALLYHHLWEAVKSFGSLVSLIVKRRGWTILLRSFLACKCPRFHCGISMFPALSDFKLSRGNWLRVWQAGPGRGRQTEGLLCCS